MNIRQVVKEELIRLLSYHSLSSLMDGSREGDVLPLIPEMNDAFAEGILLPSVRRFKREADREKKNRALRGCL